MVSVDDLTSALNRVCVSIVPSDLPVTAAIVLERVSQRVSIV